MKLLKYSDILKLAKTAIKEYENWSEEEICRLPSSDSMEDKMKVSQKTANGILDSKTNLEKLEKQVKACKKCPLGENRLNAVFGEGSAVADLMFVGEGPGFDEDHKGQPFIGRAGQLLTKIIEAINQTRETVYIANIVKCHPMINPQNPEKRSNDRPPSFEEMETCKPYLDLQIEIIKPKVIVTLGSSSTKGLLKTEEPISKLRGNFKEYKGVKVMPTYHPAALLRNPNLKKDVWQDMKKVVESLK